jgi:hypothetical protein
MGLAIVVSAASWLLMPIKSGNLSPFGGGKLL